MSTVAFLSQCVHTGPNQWSVEASDLDLGPGFFPKTLLVFRSPGAQDPAWLFNRESMNVDRGNLTSVTYHDAVGRTLTVFND